MLNKQKKITKILVLMIIISILIISVSFANSNFINLKGYTGMNIYYNGHELKDESPVYVINNTTYVPLRMLMNNFGDKEIIWEASNPDKVIISDKLNVVMSTLAEEITSKNVQIENLASKVAQLEKQIAQGNIKQEVKNNNNNDNVALKEIESKIHDYFKDKGENYFNDDIEITVTLSGDEDDIEYEITLDFDDADRYDDLSEFDTSSLREKLRSIMSDLKAVIKTESRDTEFEDADISGKLVGDDNSDYYVEHEGNAYRYYLEDQDDLDDIEYEVNEAFEDEGDEYFDDDIEITVTLSGDDDDIEYEITLDFHNADDYDDLSDFDTSSLKSKLRDLMEDVEDEIEDEIDNTDFEGADITGELVDEDENYYVRYNGSKYYYYLD